MSKAVDKAENAVKSFVKNPYKATKEFVEKASQPALDTVRSVGHVAEAGYDVMTGDFKEAGKNIAKATGEITAAGVGDMTLGLGSFVAPKLISTGKEFGKMVGNYSTGNFNRGSQNLENITGWDVDNSIAEAKERAAQEAYQKEVDAANEAEARNRRANLLSLRKSLTPSLSRSSQGGAAASSMPKSQGGIILG